MAPLRILIVGCGIAGSALASLLLLSDDIPASEKPHITVVERASTQRAQGQNIDIRGAGVTIIRKLGLETAIRSSTTGEIGVKWVDHRDAVWAKLGADKSGKTSTPTADIEILRGRLAELCYLRSCEVSDSVKASGGFGIEHIFGDTVKAIDQDGSEVHVTLAKSGQKQSYDIVVGADGLQSQLRRLVWGEEGESERLKKLNAYAGFFSYPRTPKDDPEWRKWFHASRGRNIMLRPDKQNDRTTVFMFVVNDDDKRFSENAVFGRTGLQAQKDLLREYFQDAGWESTRVLSEMDKSSDFYYDLIGQVKMDKWYRGRVVLLGDAGYCASPFSGMGSTLALTGAYNLAGSILNDPRDPEAAFSNYSTAMRPIVARAQKLAPGMPRVFAPQTEWGVWLLNFLVWLMINSGLPKLLFALGAGPPANKVSVQDFGFKSLPDEEPKSR